jgi:hypothetical protein
MINYENSVLQIIMEIYYTLQQQQIICTIFNRDKNSEQTTVLYREPDLHPMSNRKHLYYEGQERN